MLHRLTILFTIIVSFSLQVQSSDATDGGDGPGASGVVAAAPTVDEGAAALNTRGWIESGTPGHAILLDYARINAVCSYPNVLAGQRTEWPAGIEAGVDRAGRRYAFTSVGGDHLAALESFCTTPGFRECAGTAKAVGMRYLARHVGPPRFPELIGFTPSNMSTVARANALPVVSLGMRAGPLSDKFYPYHWLYKTLCGTDCTVDKLPGLVSAGSLLCLAGYNLHGAVHPMNHMSAMNMVCVGAIPEGVEHAAEPIFARFRPEHPTQPERLCEISLDLLSAFIAEPSDLERAYTARRSGASPAGRVEAETGEAARVRVRDHLSSLDGEEKLQAALAYCRVHAVEIPDEAILAKFMPVAGADTAPEAKEEEADASGGHVAAGAARSGKAKKGKKGKKGR